jgi:hypothetical protein
VSPFQIASTGLPSTPSNHTSKSQAIKAATLTLAVTASLAPRRIPAPYATR